MKTNFHVALFHTIDGTEPFATIEIEAKMPLSAMVFALNGLRVRSAGRVDVTYCKFGNSGGGICLTMWVV